MIKKLQIQNFRGLDIEINNLSERNQIIGKNDTGKTTIIKALAKILNPSHRKKWLTTLDTSNNNCEEININVQIDVTDLILNDEEALAVLGSIVDRKSSSEFIYKLELKASFINGECEEEYFENGKRVPRHNIKIDSFYEVVIIDATYDYEKSMSHFFNKIKTDNGGAVGQDIINTVKILNENIQNSKEFSPISSVLNSLTENSNLFRGYSIQPESKIELNDIYKDIIIGQYKENNRVYSLGDGREKIISNILEMKTASLFKKKIILLLEEPENHLFIDAQREYLDDIGRLVPYQIFITTHSPYILKYANEYNIIKLFADSEIRSRIIKSINNEFGYFYSNKMAELFYYDKIILVEGRSEEYFYDYVSAHSDSFRKLLIENNIGIFNIEGTGFEKYINSFNDLDIILVLKTDNDYYPKYQSLAGIRRGFKYTNERQEMDILKKYYQKFPTPIIRTIETGEYNKITNEIKSSTQVSEEICFLVAEFKKYGIFLQDDNLSFEGELQRLLGFSDKIREQLCGAKHSKLYELFQEHGERINKKLTSINLEEEELFAPFYYGIIND